MAFTKGYARLAAGLTIVSLAACSGGTGSVRGTSTRLADRSAEAGDYETAEALYRQAFDANPKSVEALVGLGRSYAGMGQYARAEQALNEAQRRSPHDPDVLLELARTQIGAGQSAAALANLDAALARRPNDISILTAKGIALDRLSRHAEAQAAYREGLRRDPTDFALLSNLGLSLGLSGNTGEGITILRELVRDGAATANTRGNLALVYGLAGRDRDAAATLASDLSESQIRGNIAYYHELRGLLMQGKPIGNLSQPRAAARPASVVEPVAAAEPAESAPATAPSLRLRSQPAAADFTPASGNPARRGGRRPHRQGGRTRPGRRHAALSAALQPAMPMKLSMMSSTAGPIRTMKSAGRMKIIIGTVIVAGRRPAFSSARSIRSVRCS